MTRERDLLQSRLDAALAEGASLREQLAKAREASDIKGIMLLTIEKHLKSAQECVDAGLKATMTYNQAALQSSIPTQEAPNDHRG
jgi:hypothetical protein